MFIRKSKMPWISVNRSNDRIHFALFQDLGAGYGTRITVNKGEERRFKILLESSSSPADLTIKRTTKSLLPFVSVLFYS